MNAPTTVRSTAPMYQGLELVHISAQHEPFSSRLVDSVRGIHSSTFRLDESTFRGTYSVVSMKFSISESRTAQVEPSSVSPAM